MESNAETSKVFVQHEGNRNPAFQTQRKAWRKRKVTPPRNRNITLENHEDFLSKFLLEELQMNDTRRSNLMKKKQMHQMNHEETLK